MKSGGGVDACPPPGLSTSAHESLRTVRVVCRKERRSPHPGNTTRRRRKRPGGRILQPDNEGRQSQPLPAAMRSPEVVVHPPLVENDPSSERPGHLDRQTLPRELVDHHKDSKLPAILRTFREEVVAPNMVPMRRPVPDASIGTRPRQSPALSLLLWHLQVLLLPDPMHPLEVHLSAAERIPARQHAMRALVPVPRERLHDLMVSQPQANARGRGQPLRRAMWIAPPATAVPNRIAMDGFFHSPRAPPGRARPASQPLPSVTVRAAVRWSRAGCGRGESRPS
jgi:hypothetical protein